jgi:hypothetical protein
MDRRVAASTEGNAHPLSGAPDDAACSPRLLALNEECETVRNIQRAYNF